MNFEKILPIIIDEFSKNQVHYALIGGFAVSILGVARATMDLDFLIEKEDMDKTGLILKKYEFKCVYTDENVSQYVSHLNEFGQIDILHAFRKISHSMLKRAKEIKIPGLKEGVRVLLPEDIIGLKIQAVANDPSRKSREFADIEALAEIYKKEINWKVLEEYFGIFSMKEEYGKLEDKYAHNK